MDLFISTPLHEAAADGDTALCEKLIREEADINAINQYEWTPLIEAVQHDHVETAKFLLSVGAKIVVPFQHEETPEARKKYLAEQAKIAETMNTSENLKELCKDLPKDVLEEITSEEFSQQMNESMADLHFTAQEAHALEHAISIPMLKLLITDHKADINYVAGDGSWPLSSFAEDGNLDAVQWLLDHGADPNTTSTGETAIFKAIRNDNLQIVTLLIERGADIKAIDVDGWSVLFASQSIKMASCLIRNGADPTVLDQAHFPCWHFVEDEETKNFLKESAIQRGLKSWETL